MHPPARPLDVPEVAAVGAFADEVRAAAARPPVRLAVRRLLLFLAAFLHQVKPAHGRCIFYGFREEWQCAGCAMQY